MAIYLQEENREIKKECQELLDSGKLSNDDVALEEVADMTAYECYDSAFYEEHKHNCKFYFVFRVKYSHFCSYLINILAIAIT